MRARPVALAAWGVAIVLCLWQVAHTRFVADLSMFLPEAPTEEQRLLVDQLRDGALTRMIFIGVDGLQATPEVRARVSRALRRQLEASGEFVSIANGEGSGYERERDVLLAYRYVLSPNVNPERFTTAGLRAAVGETVDLLASSAGALVKPLVTRDPTGEMLAVLESLRPQESPPASHGVWTSRDGQRALLIARTRARGSDTDAQARALGAVARAFESALAEAARDGKPGASAQLLVTGPSVFAVKSRELVKQDVERLATLSLVLVTGILLLAYRSVVALALGLVPVACGALAGLAAVSLGFGAVHGITLGFGTALIGEAIDYSIYLFVQSEQRDVGGAGWVAGFWPTIRLGVLTSIAGFAALLFSGLPGLAQLGAYSITGLIVAALVTRFVLPGLLPSRLALRDLTALGEWVRRHIVELAAGKAWIIALVFAAAGVHFAARQAPLWDHDLAALNPVSRADREMDARLRADLGAPDARVLVAARGHDADAALAIAERVGERLDGLVASKLLGGYDSPARLLPSLPTQRARRESLPPASELRARLQEALRDSPLPASRLGPFLEDVEKARSQSALTRAALAGTAMEAALDGLLFADSSGQWTAIVGLRPAEGAPIDVAAVRAAIAGTGAVMIDIKGEADRLYGTYFDRALAAAAAGLAVIVGLLFVALRSPARVARVMLPLAAAVVWAASIQAHGSSLNLLHLVGLLLVVAIGSNYALFFDNIAGAAALAPKTLASLTLANLTTVASFAALAISEVPVLRAIGSTVALGAIGALGFSAILARPGGTIPAGTR